MNFETIKKRFDELAKNEIPVHPKIRGVIIGILDKQCGSKENRYQFAKALGLPAHSKDWKVGEWWAISQIVKVDKVGDKWVATEPKFESIIGIIMAQAGNQEGQVSMFDAPKRTAEEIKKELGFNE